MRNIFFTMRHRLLDDTTCGRAGCPTVLARKRPRHSDIITHAVIPLPPLLGVSLFVPGGGQDTRLVRITRTAPGSPREHPEAITDADDDDDDQEVEEGEIVDDDCLDLTPLDHGRGVPEHDRGARLKPEGGFTRLDGDGRICPVVVTSLEHANAYVRPFVILPPDADYLPLSPQCYVYLHIRHMHPHVTDVVLCFGASLMRRILCARSPSSSSWIRTDRFESAEPVCWADATDVARYAICIGLAQKMYGSRDDVTFRASVVISDLLHRTLTPANVLDMESELLVILDFRIGRL